MSNCHLHKLTPPIDSITLSILDLDLCDSGHSKSSYVFYVSMGKDFFTRKTL